MHRNKIFFLVVLSVVASPSLAQQWTDPFLQLDQTAVDNAFEYSPSPSPTLTVPEEKAAVSEVGTTVGELLFQAATGGTSSPE